MSKSRVFVQSDAAKAAYRYSVAVKNANWENCRPGIRIPNIEGVTVKSSSAHSKWSIFATLGRVAISLDGYAVRNVIDSQTFAKCRVFVLVGSGNVCYPPNDPCSHHSLELRQSDENGKLVDVTNEDGPWNSVVENLASLLGIGLAAVNQVVSDYDKAKETRQIQGRQDDLMDAAIAVMESQL